MSLIKLLSILISISSIYSVILGNSDSEVSQEDIYTIFNFFQFQKSHIDINIGLYDYEYNDLKYFPIVCNSTVKTGESNLTLENCTITAISKLKISRNNYNIISEENDIIDIYIKKIIFSKDYDHYNILEFNITAMNLNENKAYFNSSLFIENNKIFIIEKLKKNLVLELSKYILPGDINKKDEINAILALLFMNKPYFNTEKTNTTKVTYFTYLESKCNSYTSTKEFVKMTKLIIKIEYSIDFNLNYKEGHLIIKNPLFINKNFAIDKKSITFLYSNINNKPSDEIIKFFINKFIEDLRITRDKYYSNLHNK